MKKMNHELDLTSFGLVDERLNVYLVSFRWCQLI